MKFPFTTTLTLSEDFEKRCPECGGHLSVPVTVDAAGCQDPIDESKAFCEECEYEKEEQK